MNKMHGTFTIVTLAVVLLSIASSKEDETCSKGDSSCEISSEQKYSEVANEDAQFLKIITDAVDAHVPCSSENCSCHAQVIIRDLKPFKKRGIDKKMLDEAGARGTKYQIIGHRLYREENCMFPARCSGIEHFIKSQLKTLPDMEMIINTRDWPQVNKKFGPLRAVFSFSKTNEYSDIMYPAWAFWEGGPAIGLYPRGLGRWDQHRKELSQAADRYPWEKKKPIAFFRGSRTSSERDPLVLLARERPDIANAAYTRNQAWKSDADTLGQQPAEEVSFVDHCQYRYLFNFRGVAASFRFKHLFLCGSLVFHVGDEWQEFFYLSLKPWVHYIPVPANASKDTLRKLISYAQRHDEIVKGIAQRGRQHILEHLGMQDVKCYWGRLLKKYAKLLTFQPKLNKTLVEIK
ncbi:hypothetical protein R5R35_012961 [Gryllus longicercus]|uniref:Glycosyl transferase CAP10 domain-containing protein n=2 Tax=Gryllus longicercus TaxID=2509291 RepID=A0AAN9W128_9ORTH